MTDTLRALALAAGPSDAWYGETFWSSLIDSDDSQLLTEPEMAFLAALSPDVVLRLLDVVEAARECIDWYDGPPFVYEESDMGARLDAIRAALAALEEGE